MKRSLFVLAGLVVLFGAVSASAARRKVNPSAAKGQLGQNAGSDAESLIAPTVTPFKNDDGGSGTRIEQLEEIGAYGIDNPSLCGFQVKVDHENSRVFLKYIPNPFSSQDPLKPKDAALRAAQDGGNYCTTDDLGKVLIADCKTRNKDGSCVMEDGDGLMILDEANFVIEGNHYYSGVTFEYAMQNMLTFPGKMDDIQGIDACKPLEKMLVSIAMGKCAEHGFKYCEMVNTTDRDSHDKYLLRLVNNAPVPSGVRCEGTVTVHGSAIAPAPKKHWWQD